MIAIANLKLRPSAVIPNIYSLTISDNIQDDTLEGMFCFPQCMWVSSIVNHPRSNTTYPVCVYECMWTQNSLIAARRRGARHQPLFPCACCLPLTSPLILWPNDCTSTPTLLHANGNKTSGVTQASCKGAPCFVWSLLAFKEMLFKMYAFEFLLR